MGEAASQQENHSKGRSGAEVSTVCADILVRCAQWESVDKLESWIGEAVAATARAPRKHASAAANSGPVRTTIVLADDALVQQLNATYRGKDKPTNVLSFPSGEGAVSLDQDGGDFYIGDVVVSFERIRDEATQSGKSFEAHLSHLIVHGILHLIGYDHDSDADADQMEALEVSILSKINIENPYERDSATGDDA